MTSKTRIIVVVAIAIMFIGLFVVTDYISAHPGNTASDGCHYCWTNCDYWGEEWEERHCHWDYDDDWYDDEPVYQCKDHSAGFCNMKFYNKCEQKAYDDCIEGQFWSEHRTNIRNAVGKYLCRSATNKDVEFYGNYSRDMSKIVALMKDSEEYQKCQTRSSAKKTSDNNIKGQVTEPDNSQAEFSSTEYAVMIIVGAIILSIGVLNMK